MVDTKAQTQAVSQARDATPGPIAQGVAELVGTFALIFVGVLVLVAGGQALFDNGTKNLVAVALAHGLAIAVMVSATMHISGGQLNPAVTVGLLSVGKIGLRQAGINVIAQVIGGILGGLLAKAAVGGGDIAGGIPALGKHASVGPGVLVEAGVTFFPGFLGVGTGGGR